MTHKTKHDGNPKDTYLELVMEFPLKSIRTKRELRMPRR